MSKWEKSKDERVNSFLNDFTETFPDSYELVQTVRKIIIEIFPEAKEEIKYGGVVFIADEFLFTGIFVRKSHISLEFVNGVDLDDPQNLLEGTGKLRRHLKLKSLDDIEKKDIMRFLKQCK